MKLLVALAVSFPTFGFAADAVPTAPPPDELDAGNDAPGFTPSDPAPSLVGSGYIDLGFANVEGDGTSFHPQDTRLPADYGVDPFQTAVNTRGDVASTSSDGRFTNGFLPRTVGIGGRPSAFVSNVTYDLRYTNGNGKVSAFTRVHALPRFTDERGNDTRVLVEQAFGRFVPFDSQELQLSVGKFDSVFGIEYLENQSPVRTGITPSLLARYTTGTAIGAKVFYRLQIAPLWSALSVNAAATNHGTFVEALQPVEVSLTGQPVLAARVGYELNLPIVQLKLGGSALEGPRNDQRASATRLSMRGADARLTFLGVALQGEYVHVDEDPGSAAEKVTGAGPQTFVSGFHVRGFWVQLAYELPFAGELFRRTTLYGRYERRRAWFEGFTRVEVERVTAGARLDLGDSVALKGELLLNGERAGAPTVDNDVFALSLVLTF